VTADAQPSGAEFDAYATGYHTALDKGLSLSGEDSAFFAKGRVDWLRHRLGQLGHTSATVLDYGCGTGSTVPLLLGLPGVQRVIATDASDALLETATREHLTDRVTFVPLSAPLTGVADLVYCNGVFHHIPPAHRADAVAFVVRALRPGGLFAFWENNPWNPGTRMIMRRIPFDRDAVMLTPAAARRLLVDGGLAVVGTDFRFYFPASLRRLRPLEPHLRRLPLGAQYLVLARKRLP
jgi:SAM-dependent methyltransferase